MHRSASKRSEAQATAESDAPPLHTAYPRVDFIHRASPPACSSVPKRARVSVVSVLCIVMYMQCNNMHVPCDDQYPLSPRPFPKWGGSLRRVGVEDIQHREFTHVHVRTRTYTPSYTPPTCVCRFSYIQLQSRTCMDMHVHVGAVTVWCEEIAAWWGCGRLFDKRPAGCVLLCSDMYICIYVYMYIL